MKNNNMIFREISEFFFSYFAASHHLYKYFPIFFTVLEEIKLDNFTVVYSADVIVQRIFIKFCYVFHYLSILITLYTDYFTEVFLNQCNH
jgi:hypothetical protein